MKRVIMMLLGIFLLAGSAQAVTIEGMALYGGNGTNIPYRPYAYPDYFSDGNGQISNTLNEGIYVLGVSSAPGGPLLNASDTTISGLSFGNYYLYAEFTDLGSHPQLNVNLSNGTMISAMFELTGAPGIGTVWTRTWGDPGITLGWASGTANLVGPYTSMVPSGGNDFYLQAGINPVPLPGAVWLLGTGLVGLAGLRKRFRR